MRMKNHAVVSLWLLSLLTTSLWGDRPRQETGPNITGQRWAVLVGIDDYDHLPQLNFAVNDTVWLSSALSEACGFPPENIFPLVTDWKRLRSMEETEGPPLTESFWNWFGRQAEKPTKDTLISRLEWLKKKVRPGDLVLFHFSGHGILLDNKGHLAMQEANATDLHARGPGCVCMDDLSSVLRSLSAETVVVIFDACRQNLTRGVAADTAQDNVMEDAFSRNIVIRPSAKGRVTNAATLFSCKVGQVSHEWPEKKHGFFSYYLTRALLGAAADASGKVTLNSLEAYLSREVSTAVRQHFSRDQVPWLVREGTNPGSLVLAWSGLLPPGFRVASTEDGQNLRTKTICVHSFNSLSDANSTRFLGRGLAEGIASRLANAAGICVVERSQLQEVMDELKLQRPDLAGEEDVAQLGNLLGADFSLVGTYESGEMLRVNARVVNNMTGEVVCGVNKVDSDRETIEAVVACKVAQFLGSSLPEPLAREQTVTRPAASSLEDEALGLFDAKAYAQAFRLYCRVSDRDINDIEVHRRIEECARLGRLERQFFNRYLELIEQYPNNAVICNYLGNAYLMIDPRDRNDRASSYYEQALRLSPKFAPPLNNLGIIAFRQGDLVKAERMLKRYQEACPEDAAAWTNLGLLHAAEVEADPNDRQAATSAEKVFKEGIRLEPGNPRGHKGLGRLYNSLGRKADALTAFQRSLALDHEQPEVRQQIELLAWDLGGSRAGILASDDFETRSIVRRYSIAEITRGCTRSLASGDFDKAEVLAQELCRILSQNTLAHRLLEMAHTGQGRRVLAERTLKDAESTRR